MGDRRELILREERRSGKFYDIYVYTHYHGEYMPQDVHNMLYLTDLYKKDTCDESVTIASMLKYLLQNSEYGYVCAHHCESEYRNIILNLSRCNISLEQIPPYGRRVEDDSFIATADPNYTWSWKEYVSMDYNKLSTLLSLNKEMYWYH